MVERKRKEATSVEINALTNTRMNERVVFLASLRQARKSVENKISGIASGTAKVEISIETEELMGIKGRLAKIIPTK
jgi:hypothetical protein